MARYENLQVNKARVDTLYLGSANGGLGTELTATPAELNLNDNQVANAVMTVGTEATNVINVAIQLNDASGTAMATVCALRMYLSSDAAGKDAETTGPTTIAIGTDGSFIPDGGDSVVSGLLISEADGDIDLDLTKASADTFYMNIVLPSGNIVTSDAITFDSDT